MERASEGQRDGGVGVEGEGQGAQGARSGQGDGRSRKLVFRGGCMAAPCEVPAGLAVTAAPAVGRC